MISTRTKPMGKLHWGSRIVIDQPYVQGDLITKYYQVPYSGSPDKTLIEVALRKAAPQEFFGLPYEPVVTKIDREEEVVIVKLTHAVREVDCA